jgi:ribonuclease D
MVDDRPDSGLPSEEEEVARRIAVLEHNLRELRAAARTLAQEHSEGTETGSRGDRTGAERFEALDRALEDAEAALPESDLAPEETRSAYRTVLHRLQDIRGSFDRRVVAAVDDAVEGRLERWE